MREWPVYVSGWQLECCGDPFAIGEEVQWTLELLPGGLMPSELLVDFSGEIEPAAVGQERNGCLARAGALHVWVEDATAAHGRIEMRGLLSEEHHGGVPGDTPRTRGIVRRIQMVTRRYVLRSSGGWVPEAEAAPELRDLAESPAMFRHEGARPDLRRIQTGLLVSLEVDSRAATHEALRSAH